MAEAEQRLGSVQFGPFELSLETQELRKHGVPLKLSGQAIQVLAMLTANPGKLVTREELQKRLWPGDSFGDFEHGLNAAVNKLREKLGDSASTPSYIETLPGRGYRFIAPIEGSVGTDSKDSGLGSAQEFPARKNLLMRAVTAAVILLVALLCVAYWRSEPKPPIVTKVTRITNDGRAKNPLNPPVTDGLHLYFTEGMPYTTGSGIAQVSAAGGETTLLATTLRDVWAVSSISPDRSQLFVARGATEDTIQLWAQPLPAGTPHRIGNIAALLATWTPDGTHIVYGDGDKIMVANRDGSEPRRLAKLPGMVLCIRYSPDGQRIRFDLADPRIDSISIWEMDGSGKNIHAVFPNWEESSVQAGGNWSPDGAYYYFQAGRGDNQGIWVMPERRSVFRRRAGAPSRLTSGPLRFGPPVPSSDGKRLFVLGEEPRVELLRYDPKTQRFDPFLSGLSVGLVAFSSDQKWIAYVSYPDMTLWRSRVDGQDKMQLTFPPAQVYGPRWSPDGSQIVFMDVRSGSPWKIGLVASSGGSVEVIAQTETSLADPNWTPDGKFIIFGKPSSDGKGGIYRLELNTRRVYQLPNSGGLFSPRVSPDGRYISALTVDQAKLMLFDTGTEQLAKLADGLQLGYNEWSHDGKYVYFRENQSGASKLVRVRMRDRMSEDVLSLKDFPQLPDILSLWIGLTPDDAPLLMRDRSIQEIYALELQFQ